MLNPKNPSPSKSSVSAESDPKTEVHEWDSIDLPHPNEDSPKDK